MTVEARRDEAETRMKEIYDRMTALAGKRRMARSDTAEFERLRGEFEEERAVIERSDHLSAITAAARGDGTGGLRFEGERHRLGQNDDDSARGGLRDSAMRSLDRAVKGGLAGRAAEVAERLVETGDDVSRSWASRWVTETGSQEYRSAFGSLLLHGEQGAALMWSPAERAAFERVCRLKSEQRAMSLTDSSGGFLVPFQLDPSIAIVNAGSISPLLDISRVIQTVGDIWHGVSSAGVQASWDAEASEVSDDSPALAEPEIPALKAAAFVPFSVELAGDATALLTEVGKLMTDGMTQLLNQALTVGSGVGCPTGIITALAGGASVLNTATPGALAATDIYSTQAALGPRWQANARWIGTLNVYNTLRQELSPKGSFVFPELRTVPPSLLTRPVHEASFMDGTIAAGKNLLVYGDFSNFVVTQRVGATVELIPHLFGPNLRPTGQRGLYMWARYGSDSINDSAFRTLQA